MKNILLSDKYKNLNEGQFVKEVLCNSLILLSVTSRTCKKKKKFFSFKIFIAKIFCFLNLPQYLILVQKVYALSLFACNPLPSSDKPLCMCIFYSYFDQSSLLVQKPYFRGLKKHDILMLIKPRRRRILMEYFALPFLNPFCRYIAANKEEKLFQHTVLCKSISHLSCETTGSLIFYINVYALAFFSNAFFFALLKKNMHL